MQNAASLRPYLNTLNKPIRNIKSAVQNQEKATILHIKPHKAILKAPDKKIKCQLESIVSQKAFSNVPCMGAASSTEEHTKINDYLSAIEDPLWKHICQDIVTMMGPASALKIWKSKVGQFSPQDKVLPITCENEETAKFVQQYDFVILGSLQQYFPALKQLKTKAAAALIKNV